MEKMECCDSKNCCTHECMPMCKAGKLIALGILVLVNEYFLKINWWYLLGALLILKGLVVLVFGSFCVCHPKNKEWAKEAKEEKTAEEHKHKHH